MTLATSLVFAIVFVLSFGLFVVQSRRGGSISVLVFLVLWMVSGSIAVFFFVASHLFGLECFRPETACGYTTDSLSSPLSPVLAAGTLVAGALTIAYTGVRFRAHGLTEIADRRAVDAHIQSMAREVEELRALRSSRFPQIAELLASENALSRLGAVQLLLNLADEWSEGRQQCANLASAILRANVENLSDGRVVDIELNRQLSAGIASRLIEVDPEHSRTDVSWLALDLNLSDCVLHFSDLDRLTFLGALTLDRSFFTGDLSLVATVCKSLSCEEIRVAGDLSLNTGSTPQGIACAGAVVDGSLNVTGTSDERAALERSVQYVLDLSGVSVAGSLSMLGASISGDLDLRNASVGQDCVFGNDQFTGIRVAGDTLGTAMEIGGNFTIATSSFDGVSMFDDLSVSGSMSITGSIFESRADYSNARFGPDTSMTNATFAAELALSDADFQSPFGRFTFESIPLGFQSSVQSIRPGSVPTDLIELATSLERSVFDVGNSESSDPALARVYELAAPSLPRELGIAARERVLNSLSALRGEAQHRPAAEAAIRAQIRRLAAIREIDLSDDQLRTFMEVLIDAVSDGPKV